MIAERVLQTCLDLGARSFVVCTGSRNSDLVHGLLQTHKPLHLRLYHYFEERCAAFFGLGLTLSQFDPRPVAIITTSGTAVAELFPAVIEAYYQGRPLILVTADRPSCYRGSGAPQAINQAHLFGIYASSYDLTTHADIDRLQADLPSLSKPVHLNVCFEEPGQKIPSFTLKITNTANHQSSAPGKVEALNHFLVTPGPLLVIAGCLSPSKAIVQALETLQAPILADATSGLHAESSLADLLIRGGDRTAQKFEFKRVLRLGGVPSFRLWRDLETRPEIDVLSLSARPFTGLARKSTLLDCALDAAHLSAQETPPNWQRHESQASETLEALLTRYPESEPAYFRQLLTHIPPSAEIFVGNSLPIRELSMVAARQLPWSIHANRGANGIDGNLATFYGLAADGDEAWAILGDLTTLYDLAAPGILSQISSTTRTRIVVMNNGGGKIFQRLPNFQGLTPEGSNLIENPHAFNFQHWAKAWGLDYFSLQPNTNKEFITQLGPHAIVEIQPDDAQTQAFWSARTP